MVVISVQARMGSTRLPGKVLLQLGNRRIISHVLARTNDADVDCKTVLTTGDRAPNDAIREWCRRTNTQYQTGPEENLLQRHLQVATETSSEVLIRVTGDCPFVPPSEINRVFDLHQSNDADYTTNATEEMPIGTAVDVIDSDILEELSEMGDTHPVKRLRNESTPWKVIRASSAEWTQFSDVHMAVDTPEDYWALTDAIAEFGTNPKTVAKFLNDSDEKR